jgi:Tfp pilus assembly protein PilX
MMNGRFQSEQGSLPTVLLVSIILGGLIVALFTVVQSSQVSSARDRDVNQSIQVADAGVQEAFVRLVEIDEDSDPGDPVFASVGDTTDLITGEAGEGTYSWQARRIARSLWEVRSVGNYRTHESVVESQMGLIPMFFYAL